MCGFYGIRHVLNYLHIDLFYFFPLKSVERSVKKNIIGSVGNQYHKEAKKGNPPDARVELATFRSLAIKV